MRCFVLILYVIVNVYFCCENLLNIVYICFVIVYSFLKLVEFFVNYVILIWYMYILFEIYLFVNNNWFGCMCLFMYILYNFYIFV